MFCMEKEPGPDEEDPDGEDPDEEEPEEDETAGPSTPASEGCSVGSGQRGSLYWLVVFVAIARVRRRSGRRTGTTR